MGTMTQTSNLVIATTSIFQLLYRFLVKFCYVCNLNVYGYFIKNEEKSTRRHTVFYWETTDALEKQKKENQGNDKESEIL